MSSQQNLTNLSEVILIYMKTIFPDFYRFIFIFAAFRVFEKRKIADLF